MDQALYLIIFANGGREREREREKIPPLLIFTCIDL